ncbi:hypothetical protein SD70_16880 [Gordoniibacillus kamchatkensis]|uniref:Uncharacterized protein n=1 Tax=Gordoniibacillus kamchatkensis TaxID=1590651 RepID=A0ABR5AG53_9BACL|nr:hypothetical protein SD70_16880 [Paenibacillus sp. VKM B-2647]
MQQSPKRVPTAAMLRLTARLMVPFYVRIAADPQYAARWSRGVRQADPDALLKLLQKELPGAGRRYDFATNGIGYFVEVRFPQPIAQYTNGTSQQPGTAQFRFNTSAHRLIAQAVLPLYRTIAGSKPFAEALSAAVRRRDRAMLERLVRCRVRSLHLRLVMLTEAGFALGFRIPGVSGTYFNEFFRETDT